MPERLEVRHFIALIFWCLTLFFGVSAVEEFFAYEPDGIGIILLIGNTFLTGCIGLIFASPDPDYFDTLPLDEDPRIPRKIVPRRNRHDQD